MKPPPKKPSPDPEIDVDDNRRTRAFKRAQRDELLRQGMPAVPPPPARRDLTPVSPMTPRPPSSAVGVPSSGQPAPVRPQKPTYPGEETPTASRNRRVTLLETLVHTHASIFDHIGEPAMTDLIEISKLYAEWDPDRRRLLLALTRGLNGDKPFP